MNNTAQNQGEPDGSPLHWQPAPLQCLSGDVPTTKLTADGLKTLSQCVFEQATSLSTHLKWACIYGSVGKGTQKPDSSVNFLVCYDSGKPQEDAFVTQWIEDRLNVILGREVDVIEYVQGDEAMGFQQMEALLTGVQVFGSSAWVQPSVVFAEEKLKEGYMPTKQALPLATSVHERLPNSSNFTITTTRSHRKLRESILIDCETIRTTVMLPNNPFYLELSRTFCGFLSHEELIRTAADELQAKKLQMMDKSTEEGDSDADMDDWQHPGRYTQSRELGELWKVLSDRFSFVWQLQRLVKRADEIAERTGIKLNP
ncbi:hypothetical protein BD410DRAFT_781881 [Rickenella mellea]|uniref:Uncharacterized protein n=1 Tax=Rickenella mellea TaxID=50990 RepID=A0A4Y7QL52_9AGAM|nr:hypothetical protein BD410DRAFT_781881 [Rickenella mellea]